MPIDINRVRWYEFYMRPRITSFVLLISPALASLAMPRPLSGGDARASCPIQFQKVDPHSYPFSAGLLGADKDPWDHYLRIEFKNVSSKTIVAIRFGVAFINAMAETQESVYSYNSSQNVAPGKVNKPYWGDGVYFNRYGWKMGATAWIEKVRFADHTFFTDDGNRSCSRDGYRVRRGPRFCGCASSRRSA